MSPMLRPDSPHVPRHASLAEVTGLLKDTSYRPVRFLGRGRMGELWVIEHMAFRGQFVLKVMHRHVDGSADRMRLEAETLGRLNHPNAVEVVDFWVTDDGRPCIVMELLHGHTLWAELREREWLPPVEALAITQQVLLALDAAHTLGLVHRDLHPNNIFLHEAPGYGRVVKVLDFGVVRVLPSPSPHAPAPPAQRTISGAVVGSPRYRSPEAWHGAKLDARSDIYSIGFVLYELLVGHGPFDNNEKVAAAPSHFAPGRFPRAVDAVVLKAIEVPLERRFQTAKEFLDAIAPLLRALPDRGNRTLA